MPTDCISYQKSGYFSPLIIDYLEQKIELNKLYNHLPTLANFKLQLDEKQLNFPQENRTVLVEVLEKQYQNLDVSEATKTNIASLKHGKTFTVTTGHQLNLFTGPLYFLYKIVSTITLCKELKLAYPEYHFVPIYWMATEDHDFEEINHFNFKNKKINWDAKSQGPVGRLSTEGLTTVFDFFAKKLGNSENANELKLLFENSYLNHSNLSDATRYLANSLFGEHGLVILNGDDSNLKQLFIPYIKEELLNQTSFQKVTETNATLTKHYTIQVNPREINLFYIEDNLRERILFENNQYKVNNTDLFFSKEGILELLDTNPEKFSPNVILRPLFQEVILPNLCYIGGGGELAYWLQLKSNFEANQITFPILLLRNSAVLVTQKQVQKAEKLHLTWEDIFTTQQTLLDNKTKEFSQFKIDFTEQKELIQQQFNTLKLIANQTDKSFTGAVKAQEAKQIKGLENLEKRLLKAEKRVHADQLERIKQLQDALFPNQSLQERSTNYSEFYLEYGNDFIQKLFTQLKPLEQNFSVIIL